MSSDAYDTIEGTSSYYRSDPGGSRPGGRTALLVFCVVFFLGAVAMAVVAAVEHADAAKERERESVEQVASQLAQRLWTYDFQTIDDLDKGVLPLATGTFERQWRESFPALKRLIVEAQGKSQVVVNDVFTTGVVGDQASAMVVYNHVVSGKAGERSNTNIYVRMALLKVDGEWKVDDVFDLDRDRIAPPGATPTTAPAAPGN